MVKEEEARPLLSGAGGYWQVIDEDVLGVLMETGSWIADLRETGGRLGHLVVGDDYDDLRRLCIRDPWEGTTYKIEIEEFLKYWTLSGIYARPI